MGRQQAVIITLIVYAAIMVLTALWAMRRTRDRDDFYLGGRRMGAWLASLSASASSSSAWTLLGVSGAAYAWGLRALWLFPAVMAGFLVNWFWVGPRLFRGRLSSLTLTEFLTGDQDADTVRRCARLASLIILVSFIFYVAAQLNAAGHAFNVSLGIGPSLAILFGALLVVAYTLLGGFWAASATDTLQGLMMLVVSILLPLFGLLLVGGFEPLLVGLADALPGGDAVTGELAGAAALAFVVGTLGIGLGYPGQPHVVNRYLALRDERALRRGRWIALSWAAIIYSGMLTLGLSARVLFGDSIDDPEQAMFELSFRLFAPAFAGVVVAAVLAAIMSTADSQLLTAASSVSHDWRLPERGDAGLGTPRWVVLGLTAAACTLAIALPEAIFARVLFAWHALGAAFGPALLVRLAGRLPTGRNLFASMAVGFGATVLLHWLPDTTGDWLERIVPFVLALVIVATGSRRI